MGWTFWLSVIVGVPINYDFTSLPETYDNTILNRKEKMLIISRKLQSTSIEEIENNSKTGKELAMYILWRPFEVTVIEPIVLSLKVYITMVYLVIYIWYEAFSKVFTCKSTFLL